MKVLKTEEEFLRLLPLIIEFSMRTRMPLSQHLLEVITSLSSSQYLTSFLREGDTIIRYLCGYHLNTRGEFMITQALSKDSPDEGIFEYEMVELFLKEMGVKKILLQTHLNPLIFRKYGFQTERYLLSKEVGERVEVEEGEEDKELSERVERRYFLSLFKDHLSKVKMHTTEEQVRKLIGEGECPFLNLRIFFKGDPSFREMRRYYIHHLTKLLKEEMVKIVEEVYQIKREEREV